MRVITPESILSWVVSSETRVFNQDMPKESLTCVRAMKNEPVSFALAYRSTLERGRNKRVPDMPISISVTSDTLPIAVYKVCTVPFTASECEDATPDTLGPCPDILRPRRASPEILHLGDRLAPYVEADEENTLNASCAVTQSIYITANEEGEILPAGKHDVCIRIFTLSTGEKIAEHHVSVELIDAVLPENALFFTHWFHYDCLARSHRVPVWSEEFFRLLGLYIKNATTHGMTALLTPAFTPALEHGANERTACRR